MLTQPGPSTATKRDLISLIFEECGQAGYEFDTTPEEQASALRKVDLLMNQWRVQGLDLNYNFPARIGQGDPDTQTGIPDYALDTVAMFAALRVAPGMGKSLSAESKMAMKQGYNMLISTINPIPTASLPGRTALGQGAWPRSYWNEWSSASEPRVEGYPELADLTLSVSATPAGDFATIILGTAEGSNLSLFDDVGGKYTLSGNVLTGTGLTAGTDAPAVDETNLGSPNSPHRTVFNITVS